MAQDRVMHPGTIEGFYPVSAIVRFIFCKLHCNHVEPCLRGKGEPMIVLVLFICNLVRFT